eukprot:m.100962 g.100962  ORF g.100962 m.100962 type:complete len:52 (+) comp13730_c0_seq2:3159-3314(+)
MELLHFLHDERELFAYSTFPSNPIFDDYYMRNSNRGRKEKVHQVPALLVTN